MGVRFWKLGGWIAVLACVAAAPPALAQRAQDTALQAAQDAFGTNIGRENVGIYFNDNVRGFDPLQAGNVRIEGLSFDQQHELSSRLIAGSAIHVGISALSYPFPAPTGIVDFRLRVPGDQAIATFGAGYGPYRHAFFEADAQAPLVVDKLSVGGGIAVGHDSYQFGAGSGFRQGGALLHWRPTASVELVPFVDWTWWSGEEANTHLYLGAPVLPPHLERRRFFGQPWALSKGGGGSYGVIGRAELQSGLLLRTGLFRSIDRLDRLFTDLLVDVQPSGTADRYMIADPPQRYASTSGEARLTRTLFEGGRRHQIHVALRARDLRRRHGGSDIEFLGPSRIGAYLPVARPDFLFAPQTCEHARQVTGGLAYEGSWRDIGELSLGLQKSAYRLRVDNPVAPDSLTRARPWLYGANAALFLTARLAVYAGHARGFEESGVASDTANNRGEAQPASITRQIDAGLRYRVLPSLTAVAGLFEVKKPYFNLNAGNLFTRVGTISHKGAELSLSGTVIPGLSVNAGIILLKARAKVNSAADRATLGARVVGRPTRRGRYTLEYGPASWDGLSVDVEIFDFGPRPGSLDGRLTVPSRRFLTAGFRYRFLLAGAPAMFRFQAANLTDKFGWQVDPSGGYTVNDARRYSASVTVDF